MNPKPTSPANPLAPSGPTTPLPTQGPVTRELLEARAMADYQTAFGAESVRANTIFGYIGSDSVEIHGGAHGPFNVRVLPTNTTDIKHWNDNHLDPYWDVELVEAHPAVPDNIRSMWIDGPSYALDHPEDGQHTAMAVSASVAPATTETVDLGVKREPIFSASDLKNLPYPSVAFRDRIHGQAFLTGATPLGEPFVEEFDGTKTTLTAWQKPDGSIWIEKDEPNEDDWNDRYSLKLRIPAGYNQSIRLDEHGDLVVSEAGKGPLYGVTQGAFATFHFLKNGDLEIRPTREFYEEFDSLRCSKTGTDDLLHDVLEDFRGNGWNVVDENSRGGGAFSITCEGGDLCPDGKTVGFYPYCWDHDLYVTQDPIRQALFEEGVLLFGRHTPGEWMNKDEIRDWKKQTNEAMLASGDWDEERCWPLDEEHSYDLNQFRPIPGPYRFEDRDHLGIDDNIQGPNGEQIARVYSVDVPAFMATARLFSGSHDLLKDAKWLLDIVERELVANPMWPGNLPDATAQLRLREIRERIAKLEGEPKKA